MCNLRILVMHSICLLLSTSVLLSEVKTRAQIVDEWILREEAKVSTRTLSNGLQIVFCERRESPEVHLRLAYSVGSKDERPEQYGLAHLVEHMIFKGTNRLAEQDIWRLIKAYCVEGGANAITTFDSTWYYFTVDAAYWRMFIDVLADCMENAAFKKDQFASEVRAVFQEIKDTDSDGAGNLSAMLAGILPLNHPYAHPVIGYKEQVLSMRAQDLRRFYQEHYTPSNALLIGVGNIPAEEFFAKVTASFGEILPPKSSLNIERNSLGVNLSDHERLPMHKDLFAKTTTVYHPMDHSTLTCYWKLPGYADIQTNETLLCMRALLEKRLTRELVDQHASCFSVSVGMTPLMLANVFVIDITIKNSPASGNIENQLSICQRLVLEEINKCITEGFSDQEITQYAQQKELSFLHKCEKSSQFADLLQHLWQTGQEWNLSSYIKAIRGLSAIEVQACVRAHLQPFMMHSLIKCPISEEHRESLLAHKQSIDQRDQEMLAISESRECMLIEEPSLVLAKPEVVTVSIPVPDQDLILSNGLRFIVKGKNDSPFVSIVIALRGAEAWRRFFAAQDQFIAPDLAWELLLENAQYTKKEIEDFFEQHGAVVSIEHGTITCSCLPSELEEVCTRLLTMLQFPLYDEKTCMTHIERNAASWALRARQTGYHFERLRNEHFCGDYPWVCSDHQRVSDAINACRTEDIKAVHAACMRPDQMIVCVVGNIDASVHVAQLCTCFEGWVVAETAPAMFYNHQIPPLKDPKKTHLAQFVASDQSLIAALRLMPNDTHEDCGALKIIDHYLRLRMFAIRERTGVFYACGASLMPKPDIQVCGLMAAQVLGANAVLALNYIQETLAELALNGINAEEFEHARYRLGSDFLHSVARDTDLAVYYAEQAALGRAFDHEVKLLNDVFQLSHEQVNSVAAKYCDPATWTTLEIGRSVKPC